MIRTHQSLSWCNYKHGHDYFSFVKIHHSCHSHQIQTVRMSKEKYFTV